MSGQLLFLFIFYVLRVAGLKYLRNAVIGYDKNAIKLYHMDVRIKSAKSKEGTRRRSRIEKHKLKCSEITRLLRKVLYAIFRGRNNMIKMVTCFMNT